MTLVVGRTRVLVSTFGFDASKVLRAMRRFGYDRLLLVGGPDSFRSEGFRRVREIEAQAGGQVETATVDPRDFAACFRAVASALARFPATSHEVRLNVSGGTKVLADAAVLAAFHAGAECWHIEGDDAVRLPVIRGFRFVDALTEAERKVLAAVTRAQRSDHVLRAVEAEGLGPTVARGALAALIRRGLLRGDVVGGRAVVSPVPGASARRSGSPGTALK